MKYLNRYADLVVARGVHLQEDQSLIINTPYDAYPFARLLAETAYRQGAAFVHIEMDDNAILRSRIEYQKEALLEFLPHSLAELHNREFLDNKWAYIRIEAGESADVFDQCDISLLSRVKNGRRKTLAPFYEALMAHEHPWCVIAYPTEAWAKRVLGPDAGADDLMQQLIPILKLDSPNVIEAWDAFDRLSKQRCSYLNELNIDLLHFKSSSTDLRIGLSPEARWTGGSETLPDGRRHMPNLPTEEIFSLPDFRRVSGYAATTKPITVLGKKIEDAVITLENGKVTDFTARIGEDILSEFFAIDEGASRLGEVALVDESSPLAQCGIVFESVLLDENASCHIAFGAGYKTCLSQGSSLTTPEELAQAGCNVSVAHDDFMIGSSDMSITAELRSGEKIPIMKEGRFIQR